MNTLIDTLLHLSAKYSGFFTVLMALVKGGAILLMAAGLALMLHRRSARARTWVWRVALLMLALLAAWPLRPEAMQPMALTLHVTNHVSEPAPPPPFLEAPAAIHADLVKMIQRVRTLNPDLKEEDVEVRVRQNKGSAIFNVAVISSGRDYARVFLNALLDEFYAFREVNREQQRNKAVQSLAEDLAKSEKEMRDNAGKLADFKKSNNIVVISQNQNQAADMLRQYASERERLRVQASEAELALKDVGRAVMAKKAFVARQHAAGGGDDEMAQGLTKAEMDYLNTRSELAVCQVDLETLRETHNTNHVLVEDAEKHRTRLEKLLTVYLQQVTEILHTQIADTERRISMLEIKEKELTQAAMETGSRLAEYARLQKACEASDATHKEVFDLMHKFTVNEDMSAEYVSVMERASTAVEDVRPWWKF